MINWKVRLKNKTFWVTMIPAVILLLQTVAALFGFTIDLATINDRLIDVVNALFLVMTIAGVVIDPTTEGAGDSIRALGYDEPSK